MIRQIFRYLNPIAHLGERRYSFFFPFVCTFFFCVLSEFYAYIVARDPMAVGSYAIFLFVALIIYFSFRDGILGGLVTTVITILYYLYIMYTRHYRGQLLSAGLDTTVILAILYLFVTLIIGWLKQTIDKLIEREANEKRRLETIIQQLPVGVLITDEKGRLVQENKQVGNILGAKFPIDFVFGEDFLLKGSLNGKSVSPSQAPLAHVLATGKSISGREYTVERPDGKRVYLQVSAAAVRNKQGRVIAAAEIITDITQQKEMEERKDDFVNMASHELKTPITSMKLYMESLIRRIGQHEDPKVMHTVQRIKLQVGKLQELVNDLLDVSRIQTGKLGFHKEKFNLDELILETIDSLQETTRQQKIVYSSKTSVRVYADRFRIYQVLTNLITNATKYSPEKSDIIVRLKKSNGKAFVSVQDFGIGISKDQQKKIFERLYQVNDLREKTFPGLGMGLYISKEIVRRHKGTIWVESEKGKGSTFYFSLPL